ncbi:MAG TPA: hypothetical protein VJA21_33125, partial [Verrucomicrobiae bacterium]
ARCQEGRQNPLHRLHRARSWRDRPKAIGAWQGPGFWRRSEQFRSAKRAALRARLLAINPLFWLAARQIVTGLVFMVLVMVLVTVTVYVAAPFFGRMFGAGAATPVGGQLFAWLWTGLAIHALVLYYAAMSASQPLAEQKQMGALELILSTSTTERTISRGLWLAYGRKMLFPAVLAVLVHAFFIWMCMVMATLDPPGPLPPGTTPGEVFWGALLQKPLRGQVLDWRFGFMLRCALIILLQLVVTWPTLGWVGRWLGLRMKHPALAPLTSLAVLCAPPVLLFSLACYLADRLHLDRMPERQFLPMMMWLALTIGVGHCVVLSVWAATCLRSRLRSVAMSRYEPLPRWRWRLPDPRAVRRFAIATGVVAIVVVSLVTGYYAYQNWRSTHAWRSFQNSLERKGESLSLRPLLSEAVPDSANFARSPAFLGLLSKTNRQTAALFAQLRSVVPPNSFSQAKSMMLDWTRQTPSTLQDFAFWARPKSGSGTRTRRQGDAAAILQGLQSQSRLLRELAAAANRLTAFQTSTNRDAGAVLRPVPEQVLVLERLHLLLQVRACAALALGQNADAAEDVLTGLRLARLARQLPDVRSTVRVQVLLARSLQPLWDGLSQHAWTGPQLTAFQHELAGFNLLADYTNAVQRVVLAHIEVWRAIPDSTNSYVGDPAWDAAYAHELALQLQPRASWFDSCIQLHDAGRSLMAQVDVAAGRIWAAASWSNLNGLPLDSPSRELLQQSLWWGANPAVVAFAQTSVNQAIVACALERFRLVNGGYPQTLEELVPALLDRVPHDAVSGRPIAYQPAPDGGFVLRGVGPNGTDDRTKSASDDWLWAYSTNTASAKK